MSQAKGEATDRLRYRWPAMCRFPMSRGGRIIFGTFLVAAGAVWLAVRLGWIPTSTAVIFWPLVLILAGTWIVVKTLSRRKSRIERTADRG